MKSDNKKFAYLLAHHKELMERERKIEKQNLDPELEYEIAHLFKNKFKKFLIIPTKIILKVDYSAPPKSFQSIY